MTGMPPLTRDQILWAAIRIADDEGPEAITLRRISTALGVHVTSLYNHVPTREAITDGIVEVLLAEAKLPTHPVPWEEWVRHFFSAMTKEDLKKARGQRTQQEMADLLETTLSAYRKWELGSRKVPVWVAGKLADKKLSIEHLSTGEMLNFIKKVNVDGLDADEVIAGLIRDWLGKTLTILLFCFLGWQILHPDEDQSMRLIGRRRDGDGAVELTGEA